MITKEQRIEAMKGVLASLFASQRTLKSLAPNFKWAGLGNLLGDYGEFIATEVYNLQQAPRGANRYDAVRPDGKKVQVKTNYAASQIGFSRRGRHASVLKNRLERRLDGNLLRRFRACEGGGRYSARDNKHMVPISALLKIAKSGYVLPEVLPMAEIVTDTESL
jgi:hypothetical protein